MVSADDSTPFLFTEKGLSGRAPGCMGVEKDGKMKRGKGFLCRAAFLAIVLLLAGNLPAAPVEPASGTIYVVLGTGSGNGSGRLPDVALDALKDYVQNNITNGDSSLMYVSSYNLGWNTPAVFARDSLDRTSGHSLLDSALAGWFKNTKDSRVSAWKKKNSGKKVADLRNARPDLVPSRFTVIADGAAGLAVREYIQGPDYRGDIANVVFLNTPHEGTGIADQSFFNDGDLLDRGSSLKYAGLVPLALAAYIVGGMDGLQELMISLMKDAVMALAYNAGDINGALGDANLFGDYSADRASSWYLAQDADNRDPKYENLISQYGADSLLGSTQLLNLGSVRSGYSHPKYNVVYSYGLPTIGNGRRTLDDFVEQAKNHIPMDKVAGALADTLNARFGGVADSAKATLRAMADSALNGLDSSEWAKNFGQYIDKFQDVKMALDAVAELRTMKFNKDDLPGTVYKLLRFVNKYIPDEYKSEIFSLFMEYFTPETKETLATAGECLLGGGSVKGCAREGMKVVAANLANYSLNFLDEGLFDVPLNSASGENVRAFREGGATRLGVNLDDIMDSSWPTQYSSFKTDIKGLEDYRDLLSDVGELETDRRLVDLALNVACEIVTNVNAAYGKICSAAEFATNVALVGAVSYKIHKVADKSGALKATRALSAVSTVVPLRNYSVRLYHGDSVPGVSSDMEQMLFGQPSISIASVRNVNAGDTVAVPLMFVKPCDTLDILDAAHLTSACSTAAPVAKDMPLSAFTATAPDGSSMYVKDVAYSADGTAHARYGKLGFFTTQDAIEEMRFRIDDLQPDSLRWIKFDFNTRVQIIYERRDASTWFVYFEKSYKQDPAVDTLHVSPVREDGLFVLRPEEVIDKYNSTLKDSSGRYGIAGLMEDGTNMVYVSMMNKLGRTTSANFSFFRQATEPNYDLGWPVGFAHVSRLSHVTAFANDAAYKNQSGLSLCSLRVYVSKVGLLNSEKDSADVGFVQLPMDPKDNSTEWKGSTNLDTALKNLDVHAEGDYLLEWRFGFADSFGMAQTYWVRATVHVDTTGPQQQLLLANKNLTGTASDGKWAEVVATDSLAEPVRAMRALAVDAQGHVVRLFNRTRVYSRRFGFGWAPGAKPLAQGKYTLLVQSFDFADPDSAAYANLLNITDSDTSVWDSVMEKGSFKSGFNGTTLRETFWVDNTAPSVVSNSVSLTTIPDSLASGCGHSRISGGTSVFNSCNLASLSFRVHEDTLGRGTPEVKVEVLFEDSVAHRKVSFEGTLPMRSSNELYTFEETHANRLKDGVYSITARLTDPAGNVSTTRVEDKVIVDRTAPSVFDVFVGTAYDSIAELGTLAGYVAQNMDDPRNVSTLWCNRRLDVPGISTGWHSADSLTFTSGATQKMLHFSITDLAQGQPDGNWTVYLGCYDAVGNFGTGLSFFGMGARFPRITFPVDTLNSFYYGRVLVKGIAPNPVTHGDGSDQYGSFELSWKGDGDSVWHSDGFEYLSSGAWNDKERDLAIWTLDTVPSGVDTLRLSVRACDTCAWVSTLQEVFVYAQIDSLYPDTSEMKIRIFLLDSTHSVGTSDSMLVELDHVTDTSAWKLKGSIYVRSQFDSSMVEATRFTFDPAVVSPFQGKPANLDSGLYIWQENGLWNVYWVGTPKGTIIDTAYLQQKSRGIAPVPAPDTVKRMVPKLTLRYLGSSIVTTDTVFAMADMDSSAMGSVETGSIVVPAYDRSATWWLDSLGGSPLHIQFRTDSSFIVDVSSVESTDSLVFCGKNARPAYDAISSFMGVGMVYVHPWQYMMRVVWNGYTDGGMEPGGDSAYAKVVAYSKADPSQIITDSIAWLLDRAATQLWPGTILTNTLFLDFDFSDTLPVKREEILFKYGLHGQPAYVTEQVVDSNGQVVMSFKQNKFTPSGPSNDANKVSWNGVGADNTVASLGNYTFRVIAYSDSVGTNAVDTLEYGFSLDTRENFVEADDSVTIGGTGSGAAGQYYPSVLTMDEAHRDSLGYLRYVGSIDYLMRSHAEVRHLPEEERTVYYKWEPWSAGSGSFAIQEYAFYQKYRYSVGIRRHREKFPVTIAVLLLSEGFNASGKCHALAGCFTMGVLTGGPGCLEGALIGDQICNCDASNNKHPYKIQIFKRDISENGMVNLSMTLKGMDVVGYNANGSKRYPIIMGIKVMPADVYEDITGSINGVLKDSVVTGFAEDDFKNQFDATNIWNTSKTKAEQVAIYTSETGLYHWFNNFREKPVFWETGKYEFSDSLVQNVILGSSLPVATCNVDTSANAADSNFVCGPKNAEEESDTTLLQLYNPHADMLNVAVQRLTVTGYSAPKGCDHYDGSGKNILLMMSIAAKPEYWNPPWGYNNLANRYVRFDPTNSTLFGNGGYFKTNKDAFDSSSISGVYSNHYGTNGWEYSYDDDNSRITAFEAERFPMRQSGMNPLWFGDEINTGNRDSLYLSKFAITYFNAGTNIPFRTVARTNGGMNKTVNNTDATAKQDNWVNTMCDINPLDIGFVVAPAISPNEAIIQDGLWVRYPFKGSLDTVSLSSSHYNDASKFVFYPDLRSRIHVGTGDWDDLLWTAKYVVVSGSDTLIRNPVTDLSYGLVPVHPVPIPSVNLLDSVCRYVLRPGDSANGYWVVPKDSIDSVNIDKGKFIYTAYNATNSGFIPVVTDSTGLRLVNSGWDTVRVIGGWTLGNPGRMDTLALDYVFSADGTIPVDMETRKHSVPLKNVLAQNNADTLLADPWVKEMDVTLDSLVYRDDTLADTAQQRHSFLVAAYDTTNSEFDVDWNGVAPTFRMNEIATFRGRVPGDKAPWRLSYVHGSYTYPVATGVQDTVPVTEPLPVLTRFNMNHLHGNASFFLMWGGGKAGKTYYRKLNLLVGNRVNPSDSVHVQSMYANAGADFVPGAWGTDPVDVTVRSVSPNEYVYRTFKNLAVTGPMVEILPSHDFGEDDSLWPIVSVKMSWNDVADTHKDVSELAIYKPDTAAHEIVPLTPSWQECYKVDPSGDIQVSCDSSGKWDYVLLRAKTRTFSDFVVLDTASATSYEPVVTPPVPDTLICAEPMLDTVWAGTYNGRLEFANPCVGRANYLLQLRVGGNVAAEHQGVLSGPAIAWEARRGDIWLPADVYTSRIDFHGVDGSAEHFAGPMVRVDSVRPWLSYLDVTIADGDSGSRVLLVSTSLADSGSGIANAVVDVRYGGYVVERRVVPYGGAADTSLVEQFVLSPSLLAACTGCRATVDVRVEDMGHNHVEESWRSRQLYPFPSSLVLWYPMSEGSGNVAHEMLAGLDLSLDSVNMPWVYGGRLSLFGLRDRSTTSNNLHADSVTPMSVEFDAIVGKRSGAVFTWHDDSTTLTLGIENGKFYVKVDSGTVELSYYVSSDVPEHCVFVFDTSFVTLYVDGNFVERVALPGDFVMRDNGMPILGYYFGEQSAYFRMSDLRIYRSALTAEQVQFLENLDSLPPYREPGDTSAVDTSVVDSTPVQLAIRAVELDSVSGLVVDQSCALPGRSYLRQGSGTSGMAVWNVDAPRAGNYALYVFGRGYPSASSRVEVSVNGVDVGTYGLRPSGLWESSRMGDSLLFALDSGLNRIALRPLGGAELAGVAVGSAPSLPETHLVDYGQSDWAAPEPSVEAFIYYENAYETTWARPRIKLHNLTGQYIYGARVRYYYSGEGSAVAATSWYPEGPASVVHDAGDVYYAEYVLAEPIPPHGYANNGSAIQLGLHRTPDFKAWKIQDDPSYEHGSAYGYVEAKGVAVLNSRGEMLTGWNCVDDGMPATTPASGIRALAAEESNEPWKNSTIAVYVENNGSDSISGFEVRYYYRDASGTMEPPDWYYLGPDTASAVASKVAAGGNLYYVSLVYNNVVLKPGKRSASMKFGLHAQGWSESAYSVSDDPSHHGIGTGKNLLEADSVVVLDRNGNLLWGGVPRPNFQNNVVASDSGASRVTRVGDVVYVNVDQTGYYYLEVVDAFGTVKNRLFEGTWTAGEHTVQIPASAMQPGRYIVLRRGNTILNWQLLK